MSMESRRGVREGREIERPLTIDVRRMVEDVLVSEHNFFSEVGVKEQREIEEMEEILVGVDINVRKRFLKSEFASSERRAKKKISVATKMLHSLSSEKARDALSEFKPELSNPFHLEQLVQLVKNDQFDWVAERILDQSIDLSEREHINLLLAMIGGGHGDWVLQKMEKDGIEISTKTDFRFFEAFVGNGQTELILDRIDLPPNQFLEEVKSIMMDLLIQNGFKTFVFDKLNEADFDLSKFAHSEIIRVLIRKGFKEWILEKFADQRDELERIFPRFFEQEVLDTADRPVWFGRMQKHTQIEFEKKEEAERLGLEMSLREVEQFVDDIKYGPVFYQIREYVKQIRGKELLFLKLAVEKTGWLSPQIISLLERLSSSKGTFSIELNKTGSQLRIFGRAKEEGPKDDLSSGFQVTFVNDIAAGAASVWEQASSVGIPCSPIVSESQDRGGGVTRVYSRYSGTSLRQLEKYENLRRTEIIPKDFADYLWHQRRLIIKQLEAEGIGHGHDHEGNFTVEFIRESVFTERDASGNVDPSWINTHEFKDEDVLFDVLEYMKDPNEWIPVVRLIDWDQAWTTNVE